MKIFAHRGVAHHGADENSVEAFCHAVGMGIDGIELDIRLTKDEEPVVVHDKNLRRIAGDNRLVSELTLKEIKAVTLRRGSKIPSLDDVTACTPNPVMLDIEIKDRRVLDLILKKLRTSRGLRERSIVSSFKKDVLERSAAELPEVRRFLLIRRWPVRVHRLAAWLKKTPVDGIGLDVNLLTEQRVAWIKEHGAQAISWEHYGWRSTRGHAERMRELGIDIAIVNQPEVYAVTTL